MESDGQIPIERIGKIKAAITRAKELKVYDRAVRREVVISASGEKIKK